MMGRPRSRLVRTGSWVASFMVALFLLMPWAAAADEVQASLSDLRSTDSSVTGTLILRTQGGESVDASSLRAELGGEAADVAVVGESSSTQQTMLVIDTSGSMGASGMATVRRAVREFLKEVPDDVRVGVVSFASTAGVDVEPTTDHAKVQRAVNGLRSGGETALYEGVQVAVRELGTEGERSIVLLSDGGDTVAGIEGGPKAEAVERNKAVNALQDGNVRAEVVAFTTDEARDDVLLEFAEAGGGSVATASDPAAVSAAFSAAARALESQVEIEVERPAGATGAESLVVKGTASGLPFVATSTVDLGASTPPPPSPTPTPSTEAALPPPQALPAEASTRTALYLPLAALAIFAGLFALVAASAIPAERSSHRQRIAEIRRYGTSAQNRPPPPPTTPAPTPGALSEQLIQMGDRVMQGRDSTSRTLLLLDRADLPWRAGEWFVLRSLSVLIGGLVGYLALVATSGLAGALLGIALGFVLPSFFLRWRAARRARRFEMLLPDVFTLVATSLSSGFSLRQSLDAVARDMSEPAKKEFSRALAETLIGADIPAVLDRVAVRMGSDNLRWAVMAIRIQQDVGGNLAETLRTTATTLREREMLTRQVQSLSAEGRLSAYILIALPIGLFVYMYSVNYDYLSLLWASSVGILMLVTAAVAMVAGIFWMRAVVRIEA